jgi:hypothetical protein
MVHIEATLPTFYTNPREKERMESNVIMDRRNKLINVICLAFTAWAFKDNSAVTFCNLATHDVAKALGCMDFFSPDNKRVKLANEIADFLAKSKDWGECTMLEAQTYANSGYFVVAAQRGDTHGHICTICPGVLQDSSRWVKVPAVMNIGKTNFIGKGLNWAFSELPKFYLWRAGV